MSINAPLDRVINDIGDIIFKYAVAIDKLHDIAQAGADYGIEHGTAFDDMLEITKEIRKEFGGTE